MLVTRAEVRNEATGASYNEICYELNMATTVPENQELESAKRFLNGSLAIRLQSRESVARTLATVWISGLPPEELGEQSRKIENVTLEDVEKAGRKYFPVSRMTVVAVDEEKVVREQMAPFGLNSRRLNRRRRAVQAGP